jgi:hypothetical protein
MRCDRAGDFTGWGFLADAASNGRSDHSGYAVFFADG